MRLHKETREQLARVAAHEKATAEVATEENPKEVAAEEAHAEVAVEEAQVSAANPAFVVPAPPASLTDLNGEQPALHA